MDNAEYYIDEYILNIHGAQVRIEAAFYSADLIRYLLSLYMPRNQIKFKIVSKQCLKNDTYSEFIRYIFDNFNEKQAKLLANSFIGHLGRKYDKKDRGFSCTEYETALCCWTQAVSEGKTLSIDKYNELYLLREQSCERLFNDNTSINRFVISQSIMKTLKLIHKCCDDESTLISINTDGFNILNPCAIYKHKKDVVFDTSCIGKPNESVPNYNYMERHYRDNININEFENTIGEGIIHIGVPGSGKTYKLCDMVMNSNDPIVLSFTNKAIANCKERLTKRGFIDVDKICYTLDSFFAKYNMDGLKNKTVFIDEYSMVPMKFINMIYNSFIKFNTKIFMFGDANQCNPVQQQTSIVYDYTNSYAIRQMCPNIIELEYIKGVSRYGDDMNKILTNFLNTGSIKHKFKPVDDTVMRNICYLNKTRKKITTKCCNIFSEDKDHHELNFKYNDKTERYRVCKDMPVLATQNLKEHDIFNMMEYKIDDIDTENNKYIINGISLDRDSFRSSFIPAFCSTVYKYQGSNIDQPYAIHDVERMCKKQLYTALSRTTNVKYIHLDNNMLNKQYKNRNGPNMEITNSHFNSNYKNGKIYRIDFNNDKIYIGQTCESLEQRLSWHLTNKNSKVYKLKEHNPKISLIVNAPSHDKKSLEIIESKYINQYASMYNDRVLNERMNHNKKRKDIKFQAEIETEDKLTERITILNDKIKINDDVNNKYIYFKTKIDGVVHRSKARYINISRDEAIIKINETKDNLVKRLTMNLD